MVPFPGVTQVSWESCFNSLHYYAGFADLALDASNSVSRKTSTETLPCTCQQIKRGYHRKGFSFFTYNPQASNISTISAIPLLIFCRISFTPSFSHISYEIFLICAFIPHKLCQSFCFPIAAAGFTKLSWYSFTILLRLRRLL